MKEIMDSGHIANMLVECGAIEFRTDPPFRFTSGAESPVYVDNRHLLGFVEVRRALVACLADVASDETGRPTADAVAGTATAGIPWAAWLADVWSVPLLYVRSNAKGWGRERSVEGMIETGWRTIVVEDLVYSGGSARTTIDELRAAGLKVDTCVCNVTYDIPASQGIAEMGVAVKALTTVDEALNAALQLGKLSDSEHAIVTTWLAEIRKYRDKTESGGVAYPLIKKLMADIFTAHSQEGAAVRHEKISNDRYSRSIVFSDQTF
jgi:orotate phosphoribosyltransferase